jgi:hypothetical protein
VRFARVAPITRFASLVAFLAIGVATFASCSLGEGSGSVSGTLDVPNCWSGPFDLQPSFFAAVPYQDTLELRLQNGPDYEAFSDGVEILIDDLSTIRGDSTHPGLYGDALTVSLPVGVAVPGVPISANADPSTVHLTLYLGKTCQTQDVALYALESVSLNKDGNCDPRSDAGEPDVVCPGSSLGLADAGAPSDGSAGVSLDGGVSTQTSAPPVGHSTITFTSLFDGNPSEVSAVDRLNQGTFTVYLADPREACPGGLGPPPRCRGFLQGSFKFYFERGRPAQPFP